MPEYRQNPLTGQWVIVSCQRDSRPSEFIEQIARRESGLCPFCAGNEHETPDAIATYVLPAGEPEASSPWAVRVVPNKYPAVTGVADSPLPPSASPALFPRQSALGRHEVIIESPRHGVSLTDLTPPEAELVFRAYKDRILAHRPDKALRYVQVFKNVGAAAGASIEHSHSQLLALDHVPEQIANEVQLSARHHQQTRTGLLASLAQAEVAAQDRIVAQTDHWVAFCPFASRFPYEVCVAPLQRQPCYEDLEAGELGELSRFMQEIIGCIESALGRIHYNYFLHTAPFDSNCYHHYHWHIEILPRLVKVAGFEWSTGVFINTVAPESAARLLRSSLPAAR